MDARSGRKSRRAALVASLLATLLVTPALAKLEPRPVSVEDEIEADLAHEAEHLSDAIAEQGEAIVIGRLARDLKVSPDTLVMQKVVLEAGWIDVLVAHVIEANAPETSARALIALRRSARGWSEVATTYGFTPSRVLRAVRSETRVAVGIARVDGRAVTMRRTHEAPAPRAGLVTPPANR